MERQDFINTINDLRSTIESLRLTIATLQRTIESLHDGEKRYKEEIDELRRQCEYLESLNKRHCKNRFSGKTLSQKNRTENKKKGRDEEKQDYVDSSSLQARIAYLNVKYILCEFCIYLIPNRVDGIECLQLSEIM